ncbi:MAG: 30S ribosomal protein S5 [Candidatus Gracilibacteria bacterium]|jgi:small subunit ribosomal protein S5|nr:30S ribosomal protein S5 [Candidatus Gracilibacteria bacterium]
MSKGAHKKSKQGARDPKEFQEEVIQIDRVTRVVKGGRKMRFRATVVIGNKKGKIGYGLGKSNEVTGAIKKAIDQAKKSLIEVPIDNTTIPHMAKKKFKSAKLLIMPAGPGTGIIAGGPTRKIAELAGLKDLLCKSFGTSNKVNVTKATFECFKLLKVTPIMLKKQKERASQKEAQAKVQAERAKMQKETKPMEKPIQKQVKKPVEKKPAKKEIAEKKE